MRPERLLSRGPTPGLRFKEIRVQHDGVFIGVGADLDEPTRTHNLRVAGGSTTHLPIGHLDFHLCVLDDPGGQVLG